MSTPSTPRNPASPADTSTDGADPRPMEPGVAQRGADLAAGTDRRPPAGASEARPGRAGRGVTDRGPHRGAARASRSGQRVPHDGPGRPARPHRRLAEGRRARTRPAGRLPPPREDHALRPRAHPRAGRARPRRRRPRRVRVLRHGAEDHRAPTSSQPGASTPVFTRFSTVVGSRGSADTVRDVRGFAVKFYTDEGIFDLVGNNIPVFFIRDGIKFPDLIHAAKPRARPRDPAGADAPTTRSGTSCRCIPESPHMLMWAMSDRAIPRSYRMMEGFGVHTFRLVERRRARPRLVKFHWKPVLGVHGLVWEEALTLNGVDPDFHRRDLVQRDRRRRLPGVGARRAGDARHRGPVLRGHRPARRHQDRARGARARCSRSAR